MANQERNTGRKKDMSGYRLVKEDILYEDSSVIVCRKRAGLATQTARLGEPDLESALKNYWKTPYVAVIHRLDQPVEGILVFARTKETAAALSRQNAGQVMNKKYYAAVMLDAPGEAAKMKSGPCPGNGRAEDFFVPSGEENILVDYLQKNGKENTSKVVDRGVKDGKRAELVYEVLALKDVVSVQTMLKESGNGAGRKQIALLRVRLKTGRHHQIRVQMANAGMPLLGDGKYGSEESKGYSSRMGIKNIALCAYSLEFIHPITGRKMNFEITSNGNGFCSFFPVNSYGRE